MERDRNPYDFLRNSLDSLAARHERPEPFLEQVIADLENQIQCGKKALQQALSSEQAAELRWNQAQAASLEWKKRAGAASSTGQELLAKDALRQKQDADNDTGVFFSLLQICREQSARLREQVAYQQKLLQWVLARQKKARQKNPINQAEGAPSFSSGNGSAPLQGRREEEPLLRQTAEMGK